MNICELEWFSRISVDFCCITNFPKLSGLKQELFIISYEPMDQLGLSARAQKKSAGSMAQVVEHLQASMKP
jgi:hypothetical protein